MDGLQNLSAIAADMPRLDCNSNQRAKNAQSLDDKSKSKLHGTEDTPEGALLRRLSSYTENPHQQKLPSRIGEMNSIHPSSQLAPFNFSTMNDNRMSVGAAAAQLPSSSASMAMTLIGSGYPPALDQFPSSMLDEYYKSQAKIHQVYVNNAVASSTLPTAPFHSGLSGVHSIPATISMIGGSPFDPHHRSAADELAILQHYYGLGLQPPVFGQLENHHLPFYGQNSDVATTSMPDQKMNANAATNYASILSQQQQQQDFFQPASPTHSTLFLPSDSNFLSEAHCFIRFVCIELFTSTEHHLTAGGRGARPSHVGQVGFRCIHCKHQSRDDQANQAVSFPSTRDNIFESVRNFQRVHMASCQFIPPKIKKTFQDIIQKGNIAPKRSHKLVRAYYSQAASEIGLIDTPFGMRYGDECGYKQRSFPSLEMLNIMEAAKAEEEVGSKSMEPTKIRKRHRSKNDSTTKKSSGDGGKATAATNDVKYGKFDTLASDLTKQVILNARKEPNIFVHPQDFPTISDFIFLLFHQLKPCKPTFHKKRRRVPSSSTSSSGSMLNLEHPPFAGLCCKHCQKVDTENANGMYFPSNVECLGDSSFSQTFLLHLMNSCDHVPHEIKHALMELKSLAREYSASVKRGSKKAFVAKVWKRLEGYAEKNTAAAGM